MFCLKLVVRIPLCLETKNLTSFNTCAVFAVTLVSMTVYLRNKYYQLLYHFTFRMAHLPKCRQKHQYLNISVYFKGTRYVSTKVHNIQSVVNPKTKKDMTVGDAVKQGIIDEDTG